MAGLLDYLFNPSAHDNGGGLLSRLQSSLIDVPQSQGFLDAQNTIPVGGGYQMPRIGNPDLYQPQQAMTPANAQIAQGQTPTEFSAQSRHPQQEMPSALGGIGAAFGRINPNGLIARLTGNDERSLGLAEARLTQNLTAQTLLKNGVPIDQVAAAIRPGNSKLLETLITNTYKDKTPTSLGEGYIYNPKNTQIERAYTPDHTPDIVRQYEYYKRTLPAGQQPMPFDMWSTAKARAGATNISNNIDLNSAQTYDKQLAEGLGKSHASLANGVEGAQTRARDIAAMQGAIDAIQKNGGTTGGLAPSQRLELQKSINAGASALGIEKPFSESDLSDKEFLTKFNRSMAGAQAKDAVGSRVTNFEMSNFLKANPGLDMTITGNQRLLGIQAQIEERNIAVGNAIRDATAAAISKGQKIDPVTVQGIIKKYDDDHHIKDPITGQDLTQSYVLPEFQNANATNASMAKANQENLKTMEKTIGGITYEQRNGQWYLKPK